ncbi:uncharacterized protein METZ01_LOCUS431608 [marine metagenome]|uniref:MaoC-like domain-containing protein n=1 Tax=marine metagenome TaxID=408172 RepID=A0A382Y6B2_9ZZZZ
MTDHSIIDRPFEAILIGEQLPELRKMITSKLMMSYGAATWDYAPIHYDILAARNLGFPAPIADGQMLGSFLVQVVQTWAGHYAHISNLQFRNKRVVFAGDEIICKGYVDKKCESEKSIVCKLWIETHDKQIILDDALAVVLFRPAR